MKINFDYSKIMLLNAGAFGISMADVHALLQYMIILLSIVLSIIKIYKSKNKDDGNNME